jgi:hypothetical protein
MRWPIKAKGRRKQKKGQMNKTEERYAQHLDYLSIAGDVVWWMFEPQKFRLVEYTKGVDPFYTPDFGVLYVDGRFELHEIKGHREAAAIIRVKVAADKHPFTFKMFVEDPPKSGRFREEVIGE